MTRVEGGAELSIDAAIEALSATIVPITVAEIVPTRAALHRVLARDLVSAIDLPNADNAAMDGYAVRAADLGHDTSLREIGRALAGQPSSARVEPGTAVRIMTGAPMPAGADTVVMLEHVAVSEGEIRVITATEPGANVRRRGEHINAGTTALALGTHLRPVDIGLATAVGASELPVFRRVRVGVLSTGDELADPPAPLSECGGYDANRPFLLGGLAQLGFDAVDLGICADQADDFERVAHGAVRSRLDVLLTSGGAALGDADIVRKAGGVTFVALNIRPGRGIALAALGGPV